MVRVSDWHSEGPGFDPQLGPDIKDSFNDSADEVSSVSIFNTCIFTQWYSMMSRHISLMWDGLCCTSRKCTHMLCTYMVVYSGAFLMDGMIVIMIASLTG